MAQRDVKPHYKSKEERNDLQLGVQRNYVIENDCIAVFSFQIFFF